jgi:hypothetical protein
MLHVSLACIEVTLMGMKLMRQEYVTINGDVSCKSSTKSLTVFQGKADETVPKLELYISLYCAQCISLLHLFCCWTRQKELKNGRLRFETVYG